MFYIISTSLAFLLSLILFTKRGKTKADLILACWLIIIGVHLAFYYLSLTVDPYYYPYLLAGYPFPLFHGPFLYFYTASLTNQHSYLRRHFAWHFFPALLIYLILIPFFFRSHSERLVVFANQGKGYEWVFLLQRILVLGSGVVYTIISLWLLRMHTRNVLHEFSQKEKVNLIWLRYIIYGVGVVWLGVFSGNDFIIFSLVALFVLALGYFGIKQVGIFTQASVAGSDAMGDSLPAIKFEDPMTGDRTKGKYLKSGLSSEMQTEIHGRLLAAMEDQKFFLNPELTLAQLADHLAVQPNHLSQVINSMESKTFYDFINAWRIREFKKMVSLPQNQKYTLLALAFECGFNSKTAFYRNFKEATGQSPTQYLHDQQIQIPAGS
ncbi:MAG: helix-turn-helix transcriptional regulator [Cytophagales bacterium]|nr:helix-turn-helix transcriptional regulator [Cytophagales bacterium]